MQKPLGIQKFDLPTDRPTDRPTDTARCRVACPRLKRGWFSMLIKLSNHASKVSTVQLSITAPKAKDAMGSVLYSVISDTDSK